MSQKSKMEHRLYNSNANQLLKLPISFDKLLQLPVRINNGLSCNYRGYFENSGLIITLNNKVSLEINKGY